MMHQLTVLSLAADIVLHKVHQFTFQGSKLLMMSVQRAAALEESTISMSLRIHMNMEAKNKASRFAHSNHGGQNLLRVIRQYTTLAGC